jgi:hypothetical protein
MKPSITLMAIAFATAAAASAHAEQWGAWNSTTDMATPALEEAELVSVELEAQLNQSDLAAGTQLAGTPFTGLDTDPSDAPLPPNGDDPVIDMPQDFPVDPDDVGGDPMPIDVGTIVLNEDGIPVELANN